MQITSRKLDIYGRPSRLARAAAMHLRHGTLTDDMQTVGGEVVLPLRDGSREYRIWLSLAEVRRLHDFFRRLQAQRLHDATERADV